MGTTTVIRTATPADAAAICQIYNGYVSDTIISFEEEPVAVETMAKRISEVDAGMPWLVIEDDERLVGYAYATAWRPRAAYRFTAESTIYLRPDATRRGLGRVLYARLLDQLRVRGFHCVIGTIALPNCASVALHEKLGFVKRGQMPGIGRKLGRWVDVGYWQLELEP